MLNGPNNGRHAHAEHNSACPSYAPNQPMTSDPLLWIVGLAVIGILLVVLASAPLKTRKPLERDRINQAADKATKKNKQ